MRFSKEAKRFLELLAWFQKGLASLNVLIRNRALGVCVGHDITVFVDSANEVNVHFWAYNTCWLNGFAIIFT